MNRNAIITFGFILVAIPLVLLFLIHTSYLINHFDEICLICNSGKYETIYGEQDGTFVYIYLCEILLLSVMVSLMVRYFKKKT